MTAGFASYLAALSKELAKGPVNRMISVISNGCDVLQGSARSKNGPGMSSRGEQTWRIGEHLFTKSEHSGGTGGTIRLFGEGRGAS
jgi:hypothetical protein